MEQNTKMTIWIYLWSTIHSYKYTDPLTKPNACKGRLPTLLEDKKLKLDQPLYLFDINDFCPHKSDYLRINKLIVGSCRLDKGDDYVQSYVRWSKDGLVDLACSKSRVSGKYCLESIKNAETKLLIGNKLEWDNCLERFVASDVSNFPFFYLMQIKEPDNLKRKLKNARN